MKHRAPKKTRTEARLLCAVTLACYLTALACVLTLGYSLAALAADGPGRGVVFIAAPRNF